MRNRNRRLWILALLVGASGYGCWSGSNSFSGRRAARPVTVQVHNNNFLDVTIYATGSGSRYKLGEVTGKATGTFTVDPKRFPLVSGLQLGVDPLGSVRTFVSERVFPDRRAVVILTVADRLESSYVILR